MVGDMLSRARERAEAAWALLARFTARSARQNQERACARGSLSPCPAQVGVRSLLYRSLGRGGDRSSHSEYHSRAVLHGMFLYWCASSARALSECASRSPDIYALSSPQY